MKTNGTCSSCAEDRAGHACQHEKFWFNDPPGVTRDPTENLLVQVSFPQCPEHYSHIGCGRVRAHEVQYSLKRRGQIPEDWESHLVEDRTIQGGMMTTSLRLPELRVSYRIRVVVKEHTDGGYSGDGVPSPSYGMFLDCQHQTYGSNCQHRCSCTQKNHCDTITGECTEYNPEHLYDVDLHGHFDDKEINILFVQRTDAGHAVQYRLNYRTVHLNDVWHQLQVPNEEFNSSIRIRTQLSEDFHMNTLYEVEIVPQFSIDGQFKSGEESNLLRVKSQCMLLSNVAKSYKLEPQLTDSCEYCECIASQQPYCLLTTTHCYQRCNHSACEIVLPSAHDIAEIKTTMQESSASIEFQWTYHHEDIITDHIQLLCMDCSCAISHEQDPVIYTIEVSEMESDKEYTVYIIPVLVYESNNYTSIPISLAQVKIKKDGFPLLYILLAVVGVILILLITIVTCICVQRSRRRRRKQSKTQSNQAHVTWSNTHHTNGPSSMTDSNTSISGMNPNPYSDVAAVTIFKQPSFSPTRSSGQQGHTVFDAKNPNVSGQISRAQNDYERHPKQQHYQVLQKNSQNEENEYKELDQYVELDLVKIQEDLNDIKKDKKKKHKEKHREKQRKK